MRRSEARTEGAWRTFDLWATLIVPVLFALPALYLWKTGYGAGATGGCCAAAPAAVVAAAPAVVAPPATTPGPVPATPTPVVTPPAATAPAVDCGALVRGVTVPFRVASATLTADGRAALDRAITCLGSGMYEVAGHTDADGSEETNQQLSLARARAVVRYLVSRGVPAGSLSAAGYGESQPVADNGTPEGKAQNRRIAFTPK